LYCRFSKNLPRDFCKMIEKQGAIPLEMHVDHSKGIPDFIISNHQGPGEQRLQNGDEESGMGILDTIMSLILDPKGTSTVVKNDLVDYRSPDEKFGFNKQTLTRIVRGRVGRRMKHIVFRRPRLSENSLNEDKRAAMREFREEAERVWRKSCTIALAGTPVKIYAEGTRSATGKILPIMPDLCAGVIKHYLLPMIRGSKTPRIDLQIVDTLQAFPRGLGSSIPAYKRPITMRREPYEPDPNLMQDIEEWNGHPKRLKRLGRSLAADIQAEMENRLRQIIVGTMA